MSLLPRPVSVMLDRPVIDYPPRDSARLWDQLVSSRGGVTGARLLRVLLNRQRSVVLLAGALATLWFLPGVAGPRLLAVAIDRVGQGWTDRVFLAAVAGLFGSIVCGGFFGTVMVVFTQRNRLVMQFSVMDLLVRSWVFRRPGENQASARKDVVAGAGDAQALAGFAGLTAHATGAAVAYLAVTSMILATSWRMGLVLLVAAPLVALGVRPALSPVRRRVAQARGEIGDLTAIAADIAAGIRVLRGLGGERGFADHYRRQSDQTRQAAIVAGRWQSLIDAATVATSGLLIALVAVLGIAEMRAGRLSAGDLVAMFGFTTFLAWPIQTLFRFSQSWTAARVAADRVASVVSASGRIAVPTSLQTWVHEDSGWSPRAGRLTGVIIDDPDARRRFMRSIPEGVVVLPAEVTLLSGTLQTTLDPLERLDPAQATRALHAAAGDDIWQALPSGWAATVSERGRDFSGGQRQRMALARTLGLDAPCVVLEEPTSALDTFTEARVVAGVRDLRMSQTTVVVNPSPLWLSACDHVVTISNGVAREQNSKMASAPVRSSPEVADSGPDPGTWSPPKAVTAEQGNTAERASRAARYRAEMANGRELPVTPLSRIGRAVRTSLAADRGAILGLLLVTLAVAAAPQVVPRLVGMIIDAATREVWPRVQMLAMLVIAATLAQAVLTWCASVAQTVVGQRVTARIRTQAVTDALRLPLNRIESGSSGDLTTRLTQDSDSIGSTIAGPLPATLLAGATSAAILAFMLGNSALLTIPTLLGLPLVAFAAVRFWRKAPSAFLWVGAAQSQLSASVLETVDAARLVRNLNLGPQRLRHLHQRIHDASEAQRYSLSLRVTLFFLLEVAYNWPTIPVLLLGVWAHDHGLVTIGQLATAVLYNLSWPGPVNSFIQNLNSLLTGGVSTARVTGLGQAIEAAPPTQTAEPHGTDLVIDRVYFSYDKHRDVLRDLTLTVPGNQSVAVVGASGSGKSTLARLVAGIDSPDAGRVTIGGVDVTALPLDQRRRLVSMVTQEHHVFSGTIRQNLTLARPDLHDAPAGDALAAVGATWLNRLPSGLNTAVGTGGMELSPAQAQQIAIARVLVADTPVIVLDEATSLLDPPTSAGIEHFLSRRPRTVLTIAHDLDIAETADRVVVMDAGRVTEDGEPRELATSDGAYAALRSVLR